MPEGPDEKLEDDHGIKEPDREPHRKRVAGADADDDPDDRPLLERETSGLKHLRRHRRPRVAR